VALDMQALADDPTRVIQAIETSERPPMRWWQRALLAMVPAQLFLLAFAPMDQFYIAWFAMVPWLMAVTSARSKRGALLAGYIGGLAFFGLNFWWLWHATFYGTLALLLYLASWWAIAGWVIYVLSRPLRAALSHGLDEVDRIADDCPPRGFRLLDAGGWRVIITVPAAWTAIEWLRGGVGGMFPWFALSQSQIPLLPICQIADITGHWGVTFWVMMCNTLLFFAWQRLWGSRTDRTLTDAVTSAVLRRGFVFSTSGFIAITLLIAAYGFWRMEQTQSQPGPNVLVIQSNFPHARGGAKTVTQQEQIDFHFSTTADAMNELTARGETVDLVAWSETVMPPMNPEVRAGAGGAGFLNQVHNDLLALARQFDVPLMFGAYAVPVVQEKGAPINDADIRNAVYLYLPGASSQQRYDKVRLVPFGEFVWFKKTVPWLHRLLFRVAAYSVDYEITPGETAQEIAFAIPARSRINQNGDFDQSKCVTPICMEDMDSAYVAGLFRSQSGKRAGFIMNVTNDGWFNHSQKAGHLQAATFRSIENRVWTARANNTGASGFIDSAGRQVQILASNSPGWALQQVQIDPRYCFYSKFGDVFAWGCVLVTAAAIFIAWRQR